MDIAETVTDETTPGRNENDGPLFPPVPPVMSTHFNYALGIWNTDRTATAFDELSEEKISIMKNFIASDEFIKRSYSIENSSLVSTGIEKNEKFELRQYQSYFIARMVALKEIKNFKPGDIAATCYFFKKVHD